MATRYLEYGGLTAWISMEGLSREVFSVESSRHNEVSCWIASETGKQFSVNWSQPTRAFAMAGKVIIDGLVCDQHIMLDSSYAGRSSAIGVSFSRTSESTQRNFMFASIEVTDDDNYLETISQAQKFGTISLELWRIYVDGVSTKHVEPQSNRPVLEDQVVHERSKKGGTHHVKYGEEYYAPPRLVDVVSASMVGSEPYVTFTFRYRPMGMLMAHGIVPRPDVPHPIASSSSSSSRMVDDEIRQLEARLQALRAKAQGIRQTSATHFSIKNVKKEIKQEPTVDLVPRRRRSSTRSPEVIDLTLD